MNKKSLRAVIIFVGILACAVLLLRSFGGDTVDVRVDYGESALYSTDEIDGAVKAVKRTFLIFSGCKLYSLEYAGDRLSEAERAYANKVDSGRAFDDCIVFKSRFRSPVNGGDAWEPNTEYTWSWIVARERGGAWKVINYGYG